MEKSGYPKQKPEIKFGALQIWVHGRQYPDSLDYWDGNWINVTAHFGGDGSDVWVTGSIIHLTEFKTFCEDIERLLSSRTSEVALDKMEPNFEITLEMTSHMKIEAKVRLTPNHLSQDHQYYFQVNSDILKGFVQELEEVLKKYPIIGKLK